MILTIKFDAIMIMVTYNWQWSGRLRVYIYRYINLMWHVVREIGQQ